MRFQISPPFVVVSFLGIIIFVLAFLYSDKATISC